MLCCIFLLGCLRPFAHASGNNVATLKKIDRLIANGGFILTKDNTVVASKNLDTFFIPASILKIATSLAALTILGPDFRFQTHFFLSETSDLYTKGFGDPSLTSEEVSNIVKNLLDRGVHQINNIFLDDSAFLLEKSADGRSNSLNPYDADNSALATNFNTIHILIEAGGHITSAEEQTPTLPLMLELGKNLGQGKHRINISKNRENILRQTGQLFRAIQRKQNISGRGKISRKTVPHNLLPIYSHSSSKSLDELIAGLMLYSNNFIANQIFLACGAHQMGYPATWEKSRNVFQNFFSDMGLGDQQIILLEGSGLSRKNRITPAAMGKILQAFLPHAHLLAKERGMFIKSGTLTGVYSYAGYLTGKERLDPFVLILNQRKNKRDDILNLLEKIYIQP